MSYQRIAVALAIVSVGACATSGGDAPAIAPASDNLFLAQLPDATLPKGKCGMILWTLDAEQPAAVMRHVVGEKATISLNGAETTLSLVEVSGPGNFGVHETQKFVTSEGLQADVDLEFGQGFDGGSYLQRGLISIENPEGWRLVVPAAGIAGCRSK